MHWHDIFFKANSLTKIIVIYNLRSVKVDGPSTILNHIYEEQSGSYRDQAGCRVWIWLTLVPVQLKWKEIVKRKDNVKNLFIVIKVRNNQPWIIGFKSIMELDITLTCSSTDSEETLPTNRKRLSALASLNPVWPSTVRPHPVDHSTPTWLHVLFNGPHAAYQPTLFSVNFCMNMPFSLRAFYISAIFLCK